MDESGNARLNYICVNPEFRRLGLARNLIVEFINRNSATLNSITLEVFDYNKPARMMYEAMGFVKINTNYWYIREIFDSSHNKKFDLKNPESSILSLKTFGFGNFQVIGSNNVFEIGIPGPQTIKCHTVESFLDDEVLKQFSAWFPTISQALFISNESKPPNAPSVFKGATSFVLTLDKETMTANKLLRRK